MQVTPLTANIGADVRGIDLSRPLTRQEVRGVRRALLDHCVLFFREQQLLDFETHAALARQFGELEINPFQHAGRDPSLLLIETADAKLAEASQGANFHADNTFRPNPPMGALLQAHVLPERGGDTCFASMYAAFEALSPRLQAYLDGMEAWHSLEHMAIKLNRGSSGTHFTQALADWPPQRHPVIAVHPETGRKLLNVNINWTTHIDGIPLAESDAILRYLFEHVKRPDFQTRIKWNIGDIACWDNRAVHHAAVGDYVGRRLMQRIAIAGDPAREAEIAREYALEDAR